MVRVGSGQDGISLPGSASGRSFPLMGFTTAISVGVFIRRSSSTGLLSFTIAITGRIASVNFTNLTAMVLSRREASATEGTEVDFQAGVFVAEVTADRKPRKEDSPVPGDKPFCMRAYDPAEHKHRAPPESEAEGSPGSRKTQILCFSHTPDRPRGLLFRHTKRRGECGKRIG